MRDLLILGLYVPSIIYGFKSPFAALMVYYWISLMNPHRLGWGFTADLPLAMIAAIVTIASIIINHKQITFIITKELLLFLLFWAFVTLTTVFAFYPEDAWSYWMTTSKIFLMAAITIIIVNTPKRLVLLLLGITLFIGFYGVKGAIFGILTGGQYKVWGPPNSYIGDNNDLGLALVMVAPLCFFIKDIFRTKIYTIILFGIGITTIISSILTYSRGALLGLIFMVFFMISRSRHKLIYLTASIIIILITVPLLPSHWFDRMATIETYEEDQSANMRLNSWATSVNLALENVLGGGFLCFRAEQYKKYSPDLSFGNAGQTAHSIYFQILMEHGFIGLIIFLTIILIVIINLLRLNKFVSSSQQESTWISQISRALFVSMMAFLVSGAFLSRAYFDLFWVIFAASICLKTMINYGETYLPEHDSYRSIFKLPSIKYRYL